MYLSVSLSVSNCYMLIVSVALRIFPRSEEEIDNMKSELEKYGIQMPAFSKIGGILANELSVDEAACKTGSDITWGGWWMGPAWVSTAAKYLSCFIHKDLTMQYNNFAQLDRQTTLPSLTANTILLICHTILHLCLIKNMHNSYF